MAQITCVVVTPETTSLDAKTDFVALPLFDGEIGIGAGHSPLIGRLGFGEMRLRSGGKVIRYYVDGGFVQVAEDIVTVLTDRAIPFEEIDGAAARRQLEEARKLPGNSDELYEIRERTIAQARAQIRAASRS